MSKQYESHQSDDDAATHLTTRRGFVTAVSFGVVSLYGLWAVYGAAPTSLNIFSGSEGAGMAGMGHGGGMSPDEFRRLTEEFVDANSLPDGSVRPARRGAAKSAMAQGHGRESGARRDGDHAAMAMPSSAEKQRPGHDEGPTDVYLMASRYGYEPGLLRLEAGVPYRFRIMAVDADHGASINMRIGSRMIRSRARVLTELQLTFPEPGEFMAYCTVYCGEGHDRMMGKIVVA